MILQKYNFLLKTMHKKEKKYTFTLKINVNSSKIAIKNKLPFT